MTGVAIVGWGTAGRFMAEAIGRTERFELLAIVDSDPRRRAAAVADEVCADIAEAVVNPAVEVVYVATPTPHHRHAVDIAAQAGKLVVVEKPLSTSVADGLACVEAAEAAGASVIVGATRSFDATVRWLRSMVDGDLGNLRSLVSFSATDWLARPRRPEDLDAAVGGGLVFRQGCHQLDIVRYVAGGKGGSIFGTTFGGSAGTESGYHAIMTFADGGPTAVVTCSGAGGFDTRLLTSGVGHIGERLGIEPLDPRAAAWGVRDAASAGTFPPLSGLTIAMFEGGDVVPVSSGLLVLTPSGVSERAMPPLPSGWDALLAEVGVVIDGGDPIHSGRWGLATLEACAALHESAATGVPVPLMHQVELSDTNPRFPEELR